MGTENLYISMNQIKEEKIERFYTIVIYDELKRKKYQQWFTTNVETAIEIANILKTDKDEYQEVHIFLSERELNPKYEFLDYPETIYSLVYAR